MTFKTHDYFILCLEPKFFFDQYLIMASYSEHMLSWARQKAGVQLPDDMLPKLRTTQSRKFIKLNPMKPLAEPDEPNNVFEQPLDSKLPFTSGNNYSLYTTEVGNKV